jgi:hypothetical protein
MSPAGEPRRRESLIDRLGIEIQVIEKLYLDRRMPFWLKLVPVLGLAFAVNPVDFPTFWDDLIVLVVSLVVFIEFAPRGLAEEKRREIRNTIDAEWREAAAKQENVIDGEFKPVDNNGVDQDGKGGQ